MKSGSIWGHTVNVKTRMHFKDKKSHHVDESEWMICKNYEDNALGRLPDAPIGKYGRMRRRYLKEYRPGLYSSLILSEKLYPHLMEIDRTANERMDILMQQLHSRELILYEAAARYLKELKDSGEEITPKAWALEELKALERLKKAADQHARQEQLKNREPER